MARPTHKQVQNSNIQQSLAELSLPIIQIQSSPLAFEAAYFTLAAHCLSVRLASSRSVSSILHSSIPEHQGFFLFFFEKNAFVSIQGSLHRCPSPLDRCAGYCRQFANFRRVVSVKMRIFDIFFTAATARTYSIFAIGGGGLFRIICAGPSKYGGPWQGRDK